MSKSSTTFRYFIPSLVSSQISDQHSIGDKCVRLTKMSAAIFACMLASSGAAWAIDCTPDVNGSYISGSPSLTYGQNCYQIPSTTSSPTVLGPNAGWYLLTEHRMPAGVETVTIGPTNISYNGPHPFGILGNKSRISGTTRFTDITADLTNVSSGGGINGMGTHDTVSIIGDNFSLTSNSTYTGTNLSGGAASYAILAGSSVVSGEGWNVTNGKFSSITIGNVIINQTTAGGLIPMLNNGLRAIQGAAPSGPGNGSSGKIEITGRLDMTLTGDRIEGIYASGAASDAMGNEAVSQIILNDTSLKMVKNGAGSWDSSAIKIGKTRPVGSGKGLVVSNGRLEIDMDPGFGGSAAYMSSAIKMAVSGSKFLANGVGSSAYINASRSVLAVGIDDWGGSSDSQGIEAIFGKATLRTKSNTAALLLVDGGQTDVNILFDRGSDLLAARDGYLIDIVDYRASASNSSVHLGLDNGSIMTGLTNKGFYDSSLTIGLDNGSRWNLTEKESGAVATSTFDRLTMTNGSVLNAAKAGDGLSRFIVNGDVISDSSLINLSDGKAGDVLTINGNYTGANGVLKMDTYLADDSSATDMLVVSGDTGGVTRIEVLNTNGPAAQTLNGIKLVEVGGYSAEGSFVLASPVQQGAYEYFLFQGAGGLNPDPVNNNDWYLLSQYNAIPWIPLEPSTPTTPLTPLEPSTPTVPWTLLGPSTLTPKPPQVLRPAVAGYVLGPRLGNELGLTILQSMHRREGVNDQGAMMAEHDGKAWARTGGGRLGTEGVQKFGASQNITFLQIGRDVHIHQGSNPSADHAQARTGLALALGDGDSNVHDRLRRAAGRGKSNGDVKSRLMALSAYHTRYSDTGGYLDLVGQMHQIRTTYRDMYGGKATQGGSGAAVSIEAGQSLRIGASGWSAEPQVQVWYLSTRYQDFKDAISEVQGQRTESQRGRLGIRLFKSDGEKAGGLDALYLTGDLLHDFKSATSVRIGGERVSESPGTRTWVELGVSGEKSLRSNLTLYGGLQLQNSLGGRTDSRRGMTGQLGVRAQW